MADFSLLPIIISAFTGGAAGAVITAIATNRRGQRDLGVKFAEKYLDMFEKIAAAKTILKDPSDLNDPAKRNQVILVVNWFELVSTCYLNGLVDADLVRAFELPQIATRFYHSFSEAQRVGDAGALVAAFSREQVAGLTALRRLSNGEVPQLG